MPYKIGLGNHVLAVNAPDVNRRRIATPLVLFEDVLSHIVPAAGALLKFLSGEGL
jgi:hypothetical protein